MIEFKRSGIYDAWKQKATAEKVYPIFQRYLQEQHLDEFNCPLTGSLIQNPLRDPHGCVFEASQVQRGFDLATPGPDGVKRVQCFNAKGKEGQSGITTFTQDQFVYDLGYHNRLMQALTPLFLQASKNPAVLSGLNAIRANVVETRSRMLVSAVEENSKSVVTGEMSKADFLAHMGALADKLKIA